MALAQTVMVFGTFDLLHPGHLFVFQEALKHGEKLIVVVARDENVRKIKKKDPRWDEGKRKMEIEKALEGKPAEVVLGDPEDFYKVIFTYQPEVLVFGYDQRADEGTLQKRLAEEGMKLPQFIRLPAFQPEKYKSSLM